MSEAPFQCKRCGMMRLGDLESAPWCRHGDVELPAERMTEVSDSFLAQISLTREQLAEWGAEETLRKWGVS